MIPRLLHSDNVHEHLTRGMQGVLLLLVGFGVIANQPKAITNGLIALAVTFVPALLERNYRVLVDPWLGLWLTAAVFLHTLGSAGAYTLVTWWDHLTHALSASLVAGTGYTVTRAIDLHTEEIVIPKRFAFVYILVIVLAFGVIWELFEFGLDLLSAATGLTMPLAQHGLDDTVRDLMFNAAGALLIALFGQAYLAGVAERLREQFIEANSRDA